ncbi:MAG: glycosyltransferase family 39 protein, partial [Butyrivibrio sp.]|nr:glycosyltransferase family 39 protein [Butyrivibrio sp.]
MENISYRQNKISKLNCFCIAVTAIKLVLMGLFSSDYQNSLFIPFLNDFITYGGNVYQRFYEAGISNAFPYPPVMLLIQTLGVFLIRLLKVKSIFWVNFLFKLPSFIIDLIGLFILEKTFMEKRRYIAVFYYASPVIIYGVYMHGQLDLIPTVFMLIAVCMLASKNKKRYIFSGVFTVLALLSKLHIIAVIPVILFYIWKRDGVKAAVIFALSISLVVVLGGLPVLSQGFISNVIFNTEQSILTQVYFDFVTVRMYIPIVAVFIVYLMTFKLNFINNELFINLCSIVFAIFLALCPPMPGWYVWIIPYFAIFFATVDKEKYKNILIYVFMNFLYIIYFVFFHYKGLTDLYFLDTDCSFLKINDSTLSNILFTIMSGTLLYLVFSMYQLGIVSNSFYKRRNLPYTIGIAGDSGSGKTTMIKMLEKCLGKKDIQYIEGDGDHRWERNDDCWNNITALNPKANYLYRQAEDLKHLREGSAVQRVDYDHNTGKFTQKKRVNVKKYLILCGLHSLYLPQTRKNLDLKIYMDSEETLRRLW